jgi:hypothetical protein
MTCAITASSARRSISPVPAARPRRDRIWYHVFSLRKRRAAASRYLMSQARPRRPPSEWDWRCWPCRSPKPTASRAFFRAYARRWMSGFCGGGRATFVGRPGDSSSFSNGSSGLPRSGSAATVRRTLRPANAGGLDEPSRDIGVRVVQNHCSGGAVAFDRNSHRVAASCGSGWTFGS